ncbi:hypothetical protein [Actinomadura macrotermitis]|uniref:Uncharacterized protein n=1 Tax=Actinomadura macrotermitis TaxID=2585200 RepID=A0A7K0BW65_9ACTN|nr:hypothetical protein [Actinomadura macrotermitis]MQY05415.1 hypothetical protein [Actinomadura macrotermitis]
MDSRLAEEIVPRSLRRLIALEQRQEEQEPEQRRRPRPRKVLRVRRSS